MFDLTSTFLIVCALIGVVIFVFKRQTAQPEIKKIEVPAFLEKPWPPETEWFSGEKYYPEKEGQYKVRRTYKSPRLANQFSGRYMYDNCIWNGKEWLSINGQPSYFQDWSFKGLTERVES